MPMWLSYDLQQACQTDLPHEALGRAPEEDETFAVDSKGYRVKQISGVVYPGGFHKKGIEAAKERDIAASDIVICTYPKCGTTWMQQIVLLLLAEGDKSQITDVFKQSPWIEMLACQSPEALANVKPSVGGRVVWKTHAPSCNVPWKSRHPDSKMIVVARNPFDACVSMYHHALDTGVFAYTGDWEHFMHKIYLTGVAEHGDFWEWHGGWYNAMKTEELSRNTMWITFEDMKADPCASVTRVAEFLGIAMNDDLLEKVVGSSDFSAMKQQFAEMDKQRAEAGEYVKKNHIREGKSGAWRKTFTDEQAEMFEKEHKARSAKFGLPEGTFTI